MLAGSFFGVGNEKLTIAMIAAFFVAIILCMEFGRWLGRRSYSRAGDEAFGASGTIDGAMFALLGLLIAFTFSGAALRFEERRALIRDEANAVGTAYLRVDLVNADAQPVLRQNFRDYLDARLDAYSDVTDPAGLERKIAKAGALQLQLWGNAVAAAAATPGPQATTVLLPAINEMFDMATTRIVAVQTHPPMVVFGMLAFLALACSTTAGFGMASGNRRREWLHVLAFASSIALTLYVIIDLEYPRIGLVTITGADQILRDVRATMGPALR